MQNHSSLSLWSSHIVVDIDNRDVLNASLLPYLLDVYKKTAKGNEHYEREAHNIFTDSVEPVKKLEEIILNVVKQYYDIGNDYEIDGHEIVSKDRQFIKTHVDSEEGDITLQYFVKCPKENKTLPLNSFGNAAFVLVNTARPPGVFRFENEIPNEFPLLPRDGLLVMYRSYIPHYQMPYEGDSEMVQVVCNIKVKRSPH